MRNVFLAHDGGAIIGSAVETEAPAADRIELKSPSVRAMHGLAGWLTQVLNRAMQSSTERYLAGATDLSDLERRLEAMARGEHRYFD